MRSSHLKQRLSDLLIKNNLITEEQLKTAIDTQRQKGGQLSGIFVELGFITEKDLVRILSQEFKMPPINLSRINIDPKVVQIIPVQIARFYQTLPISLLKNQLTLVLADPLNVLALDEIKTITGYEINPVLATEAEIIQAIDKCYSESSEEGMGQILDDINKSEVEIVEGKHPGDQEQESTSELLKLVDEAPVIKITNKLLLDAVKNKASDLFIEPMEKTMRIRCRLDGIIVEFKSPPKSMHNAIISRIKVLSNLDISEHRLPQDGRFKIKINKEEINFRVSIIPSILGEKAVLRVLDNTSVALDLNTLGFEAHDLETIREALTHPYGMMLVSGPTGSGKTTTLYSMLGYVNSPEKNLVTVEDPVEYQLEGINQVPVNEQIGLTFSAALRSILRQDPDVVMIGEIRDYETVDIAIKAALTGHLVFSTLHTNSACGSITRMINMGVEPFLITSSVIMVTAQRLLRRVCKACYKEYNVNHELLEDLGLQDQIKIEETFYKAGGCQACNDTGYKGRVGITELFVMNPEIREAILTHAPERVITRLAVRSGMRTLRQDALRKAEQGLTTLEEVARLTIPDTHEDPEH